MRSTNALMRFDGRTTYKSPQPQHAIIDQDPVPLWAHRGNALATAYETTRDKAHLNEAIALVYRAVQATPQGSPVFSSWCYNIGTMLVRRSEHTGSMSDLEDSIHWSLQAVCRTSADHPRRASRLNSLATSWGRKYERTQCQTDLHQAFAYSTHAISSCYPQDADRLVYINNLANLYALGFKAMKHLPCIDAAIDLTQQVVQLAADQPERRVKWISNLGTMIYWRYQHTNDAKDYTRAMVYGQEAARQSPSSLPSHSIILSNLADLLAHDGGDMNSQKLSLRYYIEASKCVSATAEERLRAAMKAANSFISLTRWEEAGDILCKAIGLLYTMDFEFLSHSDIQYTFRDFSGLGALTASAFLQTERGVWMALMALESGRGIMADLHLRNRNGDPVGELMCNHQYLPYQSESNRAQGIKSHFPNSFSSKRFTTLIFPYIYIVFPRMDQASFISECRAAATAGPIVVLMATRIRCDAILIETNRIRLIPLTKLHINDIASLVGALQGVHVSGGGYFSRESHTPHYVQPLGWLWETIARPVLEALGFCARPDKSPWPRIWWIPTGALSQVPIHAAGLHEKDSGETVIDRCVSSYCPSLRSLIQARRYGHTKYDVSGNHLLISMCSTPGLPSLPLANTEINEIADLMPEVTITGRVVTLEDPTKEEALRHITDAHTIHFAGHGISHPLDPLRSYMALKDWQEDPLTVEDILLLNKRKMGLGVRRPFLAYLSACSTGQILAHDLTDESMSLMSAFQLIGFRHTVANLWEMTDELLVRAATRFYTEMRRADKVTDETIAWCAHVTTRELRDAARKDAAIFASWPAYVHSGP